MANEPIIHDRGRGPEIRGSRITVYDVLDYYPKGWAVTQIAELFHLREEQVRAAIEYIEGHREQVMAEYEKMLERDRKGDSPEVRARQAESHARLLALRDRLVAEKEKKEGSGDVRAAG